MCEGGRVLKMFLLEKEEAMMLSWKTRRLNRGRFWWLRDQWGAPCDGSPPVKYPASVCGYLRPAIRLIPGVQHYMVREGIIRLGSIRGVLVEWEDTGHSFFLMRNVPKSWLLPFSEDGLDAWYEESSACQFLSRVEKEMFHDTEEAFLLDALEGRVSFCTRNDKEDVISLSWFRKYMREIGAVGEPTKFLSGLDGKEREILISDARGSGGLLHNDLCAV